MPSVRPGPQSRNTVLLLALIVLANLPVRPGHAQSGKYGTAPSVSAGSDLMDATQRRAHFERIRRLNSDREKQMLKDGERLIALASDLRIQTSTANAGSQTARRQLSANSLREAEEIGKLAHSVQEKMAETYNK